VREPRYRLLDPVTTTRVDFDPYLNDPTRWATSMRNHAELMVSSLDVVAAQSVVEVGAFAGDLTLLLLDWAAGGRARVSAIDPSPREQLVQLEREHPELELIRETSLEALPRIPVPDVVIIDGDHNYYTVSEELRVIGERAEGADLPLLLFHDVCWPHGRRDDYFAPELIPEEYRQPIAGSGGGVFPGDPALRPGGLPYVRSAAREGGPRNGVLTAVEDFVAGRDELRLAVVPAFFGFGAVWHLEAGWAGELAELLDPWDRNSVLERLEANRVYHLAVSHARQVEIWKLQERQARQEAVLRRMLESSAFSAAERLSRLRKRLGLGPTQSVVSKDEVRRALAD
jgi:SAM-dependent methyltransferase